MKKDFWLFQPSPQGLSRGQKGAFWLWNVLFVLLSAVGTGLLSLLYAYGDYSPRIMLSYLSHPRLLWLNLLPVIALELLLWFLLNRAWLAFLLSGATVWGFSVANYYMLRFRDDPLMFRDLKLIREAKTITQNYDLSPDFRILFGLCCLLLGTVFLFFLVRGRLGGKQRALGLVLLVLAALPGVRLYASEDIYVDKTKNQRHIDQWSATQQYLSRGFVYPFLHSIWEETLTPPEGYREEEAQALLAQYTDADIPADKKLDLITIQLEAFSDLSRIPGIEGVDWDRAYGIYHGIEAESYTGELVTNIFAGGTINTERAFLTGFAQQWNMRENTNSYGWYFQDQGYAVEGSHPSYEWFYNRKNVNPYLGIPTNYFFENHYHELSESPWCPDKILIPEIYRLYTENRKGEGKPYFSFNVTYQGHGPYETDKAWRGEHYTDGRYSPETTNILDNYLASLRETAEQLRWLMDQLNQEERPVVLVAFGDHKPWLGDGSSAYAELGINLDTGSEEGFLNYYSTRYFIWANDAAEEVLGHSIQKAVQFLLLIQFGSGIALLQIHLLPILPVERRFPFFQFFALAQLLPKPHQRRKLPLSDGVKPCHEGPPV